MSRLLYFAYGSNLDCAQMQQRCPSAEPVGVAHLDHYRLDFTHFSKRWRGGAADVVLHFGGRVWGVLYDLGAHEVARLDRFEGGYERLDLHVEDAEGVRRRAISYSVRRKRSFHPRRSYLDQMIHGGERFGLPPTYLERLRGLPTWEDVDPLRPLSADRQPTRSPRRPR